MRLSTGNVELCGSPPGSAPPGNRSPLGSDVEGQIGFSEPPRHDRGDSLERIVDETMVGQAPVLGVELIWDRGVYDREGVQRIAMSDRDSVEHVLLNELGGMKLMRASHAEFSRTNGHPPVSR
jgi:hypothetical protein